MVESTGDRPLTQRADAVWYVRDAEGELGAGVVLPPGRNVLAALEEQARNKGFEYVRLDCVARNTELTRFYEREGYYPVGGKAAVGSEVLRLEKNLVAAHQLSQMLEGWQPELTGTLLFVVDGDQVLLIDKKTGHGAGKVNAPGGKLEAGETPAACAIRETFEEVGIRVERPRLMARLKFVDTVAPQWFGYVFVAEHHTGNAVESREADPHWYALDAIPYDRMWQDDRIWLPLVLAGHQLDGEFLFDEGSLRAHRLA